jgi:histidine triad (HIT) family protein
VAPKLAAQLGVGDAFRVAINNGAGAGQSVFHLHLHILGGRPLKWPPG